MSKISQLFCQINSTENRSVLHVALRAPRDAVINSDGVNVVPEVWSVKDKIKQFSETFRSGSWVIFRHFLYKLNVAESSMLIAGTACTTGWGNWKGIDKCCVGWNRW